MSRQPKKYYPIDQSPLYRLRSRKRLAEILFVSVKALQEFSSNGKSKALYREWDTTSKSGKPRRIEEPIPKLKKLHSRIGSLLAAIKPPDFLFCPVRGRSYVTNAHIHREAVVVRKLDIKTYFPSTVDKRVYWFFHKRMHCTSDVAAVLTALCTLNGHLPTGSPLSPILSFFAHLDMWERIEEIVRSDEKTLSVYMDDIVISGSSVSEKLIWDVKREIHRAGLRYHKEKLYRHGLSEITGVIVRNGKLVAPNRTHLKLFELREELAKEKNSANKVVLTRKIKSVQSQARQVAFNR